MDALGLALSLALSSGLQILAAGNGISAPSGAQLAIFCVQPQKLENNNAVSVIPEQVYVVSKGHGCKYVISTSGSSISILDWTFGSTAGYGSVVYLG